MTRRHLSEKSVGDIIYLEWGHHPGHPDMDLLFLDLTSSRAATFCVIDRRAASPGLRSNLSWKSHCYNNTSVLKPISWPVPDLYPNHPNFPEPHDVQLKHRKPNKNGKINVKTWSKTEASSRSKQHPSDRRLTFYLQNTALCPAFQGWYQRRLLDHEGRQGLFAHKTPTVMVEVRLSILEYNEPCLHLEHPSAGVLQGMLYPYHILILGLWGHKNHAHNAEFNNLSECSLNFRINGRAPFCLPACIVTSLSFPVCTNYQPRHSSRYKWFTSPWSSNVAPRSTNMSTMSFRWRRGSSSDIGRPMLEYTFMLLRSTNHHRLFPNICPELDRPLRHVVPLLIV